MDLQRQCTRSVHLSFSGIDHGNADAPARVARILRLPKKDDLTNSMASPQKNSSCSCPSWRRTRTG